MSARRILITGASSGIGAALAEHYAAPEVTLGLLARRAGRLEALAARLRGRGAVVHAYPVDVCEREATAEAVQAFHTAAGGVDLAIANAGVSHADRLVEGDAAPSAETIAINVQGVLHTLVPLMPLMIAQGGGHLVTVGSVAGFRGLPGKGGYCASKAAVKTLMDAWRPVLRPHGIRVTLLAPGWIETELTADNPYPMPFIMGADKAARLMAKAIARRRRTYVLPWQMRLVVPLMKLLPDWMLPSHAVGR